MSEPLCSNCKHDCAEHGKTLYGDTVCRYGTCKCRSNRNLAAPSTQVDIRNLDVRS